MVLSFLELCAVEPIGKQASCNLIIHMHPFTHFILSPSNSAAEIAGAYKGCPQPGPVCGEKDGGLQGQQDKGEHLYVRRYIFFGVII